MAKDKIFGRAADQVVEAIESRVHAGLLKDGQPLPPERDLMDEFGISRTVVREAVRLLSSRGLVEAKPRFRPVVRKPNSDTAIDAVGSIVKYLLTQPGGVKNLFDTRVMIETSLARQAATLAGKDDIAAMKEALSANEDAIENSEAFYQTDIAFHQVLYEIPRNPVLPAIHKAYTAWLAPQWSRMPRLANRNRVNFKSHSRILESVMLRDPDAAEEAMRDHLRDAWAQVSSTFSDL